MTPVINHLSGWFYCERHRKCSFVPPACPCSACFSYQSASASCFFSYQVHERPAPPTKPLPPDPTLKPLPQVTSADLSRSCVFVCVVLLSWSSRLSEVFTGPERRAVRSSKLTLHQLRVCCASVLKMAPGSAPSDESHRTRQDVCSLVCSEDVDKQTGAVCLLFVLLVCRCRRLTQNQTFV